MEESLKRLSLLLFGCSFIWVTYTATMSPEYIPILRHLGIDGSDFDWAIQDHITEMQEIM